MDHSYEADKIIIDIFYLNIKISTPAIVFVSLLDETFIKKEMDILLFIHHSKFVFKKNDSLTLPLGKGPFI